MSLAERGHSLTLNGEGTAFKALIEPVGTDPSGEHAISREEAATAHVHALRSDLPSMPSVGEFLHESVTGARYRITEFRNHPSNPVVIFQNCEVSQ